MNHSGYVATGLRSSVFKRKGADCDLPVSPLGYYSSGRHCIETAALRCGDDEMNAN